MPETQVTFAAVPVQPELALEKVFVGNIVRTNESAQLLVYTVREETAVCLVISGQLLSSGGLTYPMGMCIELPRQALIERDTGPSFDFACKMAHDPLEDVVMRCVKAAPREIELAPYITPRRPMPAASAFLYAGGRIIKRWELLCQLGSRHGLIPS